MHQIKLPNVCSWLCRVTTRSRLCQVLFIFCVASVSLNIILLVSRYSVTTVSKRSSVLRTRPVITHATADSQQPMKTGLPPPGLSLKDQRLRASKSRRAPLPLAPPTAISRGKPPRLTKGKQSKVLRNASTTHERMPLCPMEPPGLVGLSKPVLDDTNPRKLKTLFPEMEKGGRIKPRNCIARQRLAIIIPFRNRHTHLYILLRNLIPFLQKQMADATIFIIEQAPPSTFNRGALLNIGFLEALKMADFACFLLHDVDLIPMNDRNFYRCGANPHHYASAINKNSFRLRYETYFGGVSGFSKEQYIKVNGNSNLYFGWGGEDDDLALRTLNKNYTLDRYGDYTSRYLMIKHTRDKGNEKNFERRKIMKSAAQRQDVEGLNTTKYKVNSIKFHHLYTWINVSLDMKEVLDTAPDYTKQDMWKLLRDVRAGILHR